MAELIGVSVPTLQRWDREGVLKAHRTPTNRRYYTKEQYLKYINEPIENQRKVIGYLRVSSRNQTDDLKNQKQFIKQFCNAKGIVVDDYMTDIGSGLNYKRKNWNELLDQFILLIKIDSFDLVMNGLKIYVISTIQKSSF